MKKVKKKRFTTELGLYTPDRYTRPALMIRLPERIANSFRWGDIVKVEIQGK